MSYIRGILFCSLSFPVVVPVSSTDPSIPSADQLSLDVGGRVISTHRHRLGILCGPSEVLALRTIGMG